MRGRLTVLGTSAATYSKRAGHDRVPAELPA
jgi:hypothetical protein